MKKKLLFGGIVSIAVIIPLYIATVVAFNFNRPAQTAKPAVASQEVTSKPVKPETPPTAEELLRLVNIEREKVGVKPLVIDANMTKTAQWKADDMHTRKYFSHFPATIDGVKNTQKYTVNYENRLVLGVTCIESSENIVDNIVSNDSKTAVEAWVDSKPHYKAMINPDYTLTGFGISGTKIVQHFCIAR